jgi:hypothetical protein
MLARLIPDAADGGESPDTLRLMLKDPDDLLTDLLHRAVPQAERRVIQTLHEKLEDARQNAGWTEEITRYAVESFGTLGELCSVRKIKV